MAREIVTVTETKLPAVDTRQPASMVLLPPWLATQIALVSDPGYGRTIIDPVTKEIRGQVATMPASKMPTGSQREAIARRIEELEAAGRPGPARNTLAILGELVQEYAPARVEADVADVKVGAYLDAVEDLPAWAVREAVRRWRRGEGGGDSRDYDFAPRPARLRAIAGGIAAVATGQAMRLRRILEAEAEVAMTDEQRGGALLAVSQALTEVVAAATREAEA